MEKNNISNSMSLLGAMLLCCAWLPLQSQAADKVSDSEARCAALGRDVIQGTKNILDLKGVLKPAGEIVPLDMGRQSPPLPAHCDVTGRLQERKGTDGQQYSIRFHLRLPVTWNGRFFFQGGGGTNGEIGSAIGMKGEGNTPALLEGYAVVSQDSGHSNALNVDPARSGNMVFGFDAEARQNYGHASLKAVYDTALALTKHYYAAPVQHAYFYGCSKGGQEGMAFAQRYPEAFDGIVAAAPGFSLPRAAVAEAWDTQAYSAIVRDPGAASVPVERLPASFTNEDLQIVADSVLAACDKDDGLADGQVNAFEQCTTAKVQPRLQEHQCASGKQTGCLSSAQIGALIRGFGGPRNAKGEQLYTSFPWDAGVADVGWRIWKIGVPAGVLPVGAMPPINVLAGGGSLPSIFSTPPRAIADTPQAKLDYLLGVDFDRDAKAIYATAPGFPRSAWEDIEARSDDLSAFKRRGGRMIVPHGVSDPVFSINDTLAWFREVDSRLGGEAASVVRVFAVPGMAHCGGGRATDHYDAFKALVAWVEQGVAPDQITASAGPGSAWPKRTRPLCAYPRVAKYTGHGDVESASSFSCLP